MALKFEIDSLEGVDEKLQGEYTKGDDGKFRLSVDGIPDVTGLKRKVDELLNEKKTEAQKRKEAEDAKAATEEAARLEKAKKDGDFAAIEKSYKEKIAAIEAGQSSTVQTYTQMINKITSEAEAVKLAAAWAIDGSADALLPHIKGRLVTELVEGQAKIRVLDEQGKPSAASIQDLEKEIRAKSYLAPILRGSSASGGGHIHNGRSGGAAADTSKLSPIERINAARANITQ